MASIIQRFRKIPWWIPLLASGGTGLVLAFFPNVVSKKMSTEISLVGVVLLLIAAIGLVRHLCMPSEESEDNEQKRSLSLYLSGGLITEEKGAPIKKFEAILENTSKTEDVELCKVLIHSMGEYGDINEQLSVGKHLYDRFFLAPGERERLTVIKVSDLGSEEPYAFNEASNGAYGFGINVPTKIKLRAIASGCENEDLDLVLFKDKDGECKLEEDNVDR